jgi:hypothetical protein
MMTKGRPKTQKPMPKYGEPKLITVHRVTYPGIETVQQYYQYVYEVDDDVTPYVESCPGCAKKLGYKINDHKCDGSLTDNPIDTKMTATPRIKLKPKAQADREFNHYVANLTHPIQVSD